MFFPKKIYCRVFQEVFHMAIPFLPYRKPALLHHTDALVPLFQRKGISRILLVTDPVVRGNQITYPLETALKQAGIGCIVYDQTVSNPTTDQVEEARALYNAHHCQAIIGFGGGSSIDCAKAVGARIARPRKTLDKMEGILQVWKKIPLLIAIPTTAGTGSETTSEQTEKTVFIDRFFHAFPQNISKSKKWNTGTCACIFYKRLVKAQKTQDSTGADEQDHNTARKQLGFVQKNLYKSTDQSTYPECIKIIHGQTSVSLLMCSMTTPWAIPATDSPSLKLTLESMAPVGTKRTRFQKPDTTRGRI